MKKIIAMMLVLVMVIAVFASCVEEGEYEVDAKGEVSITKKDETEPDASESDEGKGSDQGGSESSSESSSGSGSTGDSDSGQNIATDINGKKLFESAVPANPEMEVQDLVIAYRDDTRYSREWESPEGATGELSEIITIRNDEVNKNLGTNIKYEILGSGDYMVCLAEYRDKIIGDVLNGTHKYDIIAGYAYAIANLEIRDCLANLADKNTFPYFDFSLPCWNQSIVKNTKVNNKLYYVTGDLNLSTFDASIVTFVNKKLYNNMKLEGDPADIQNFALEGKWTYEEMHKWSSRYRDVNADGVNDCADIHGISVPYSSIPLDAFPAAWDLDYVVTNGNRHSYNILGNTKITQALTKVNSLLSAVDNHGVTNADNRSICSLTGARSEPIIHFVNDRAVFVMHKLWATPEDSEAIVSMSSEYGLMPMPKYDATQTNYGTTTHDSYTLMVAPNHKNTDKGTCGKAISAWLQLATEESYMTVRDIYINRIVKPGSVSGDNATVKKSVRIFNVIADNIEFSFLDVYAPQLGNVLNTCWREAAMYGTTAEAQYAANQDLFNMNIQSLDEWLAK